MKRRLCRREAKRTETSPCAEGTLHGVKPCFIFHAPQVRFIEKSHPLTRMAFFLAGAEGLTDPDFAREFGMHRGFGSGARSQQFRRIRAEMEGFCVSNR